MRICPCVGLPHPFSHWPISWTLLASKRLSANWRWEGVATQLNVECFQFDLVLLQLNSHSDSSSLKPANQSLLLKISTPLHLDLMVNWQHIRCVLPSHRNGAPAGFPDPQIRSSFMDAIMGWKSLQALWGEHPIAPARAFWDDRPRTCETYGSGGTLGTNGSLGGGGRMMTKISRSLTSKSMLLSTSRPL